jgi:hypothetical protein
MLSFSVIMCRRPDRRFDRLHTKLLLIERRLTTARGVSVRCDVFEGDKFEMA